MSDCVAICEYPLYSSFPPSAYISLTIPIVSKSRSRIEMPSCTQRSRNSGVVIWRSVGRSFFRRNIGLGIQSPQLDNLRKHLVDGEGAEFIQPLLRAVRDGRVCVLCHDVGDISAHSL